jgi:hypothetical protein
MTSDGGAVSVFAKDDSYDYAMSGQLANKAFDAGRRGTGNVTLCAFSLS